jgi:DNA-binding response OmpR family regulator
MVKKPGKNKILIVEDEPFLVEMYKTRFEQEGYDVAIALSGATVSTTMKENKPDLVLLDLIMPEVDGYQVLQEVKSINSIKDVPVLIFSNLAQEEEIEKGFEYGADDYFVKSNYIPSQIVEKVEKMIKQKKGKKKTATSKKKPKAKKPVKKKPTKKKSK